MRLALNRNLALRTTIVLVLIAIGALFAPFLEGLTEWAINRMVAFEDGAVTLPERWTSGEKGHLLSVKRSGVTLLFPSESRVMIDPFAERWPAEKVEKIGALSLRGHGSPVVAGRFKDPFTGTVVAFATGTECVSPDGSRSEYVRIYCLSADSVHSFEFFGQRDAIAGFASVLAQATQITGRHSGSIVRR